MKGKYLLVAFLILAIMTIGAVSASDNITADDLAVEDAIDDSIEVADDSVAEIADEEDEILGYYEFSCSDFRIDFRTNIMVRNSSADFEVITFTFYDVTNNYNNYTYAFKVNGNWSSFNKTVTYDDSRTKLDIEGKDLGITDYGTYVIEVWEKPRGYDQYYYRFSQTVYVSNINVNGPSIIMYGNDLSLYIELPRDATGTLTVTLNGRTNNVSYSRGFARAAVKTDGLGLGNHAALVEFSNDAIYKPSSREFTFEIRPKVSIPDSIDFLGDTMIFVGENRFFTITCPSTVTAQVNLTVYYYNNDTVYDNKNITLSNGSASYSLAGLPEGEYYIDVDYMIDNRPYPDRMSFIVTESYAGFKASATSQITEGGYVNVIIDVSPATTVTLSVDGIETKFYTYNSHIDDLIGGLSVGTHKITVLAYDYFYSAVFSKTFTVTVKAKPVPDTVKMTLKKVKVKRSAKKLVLQSTLKINGKAKKGLVVKFKFNKKTYSAKTDAKGIAKVTIKKTVLKKLKAGKKITYQASYGKTVKKITVKVLK